MDRDGIYQKLTGVFHDVFGDDEIVLRPDMTADDVDEWDSLSHVRLVMKVEKVFQVKFTASEIGKLKNVAEFVDLVHAKTT